ALSPDLKTFARDDFGGKLLLCEMATGKQIRQFRTDAKQPEALAFSPDAKVLASSESNAQIVLRDVPTGKRIRTHTGMQKSITSFLAFSPDGRKIAAIRNDCAAGCWPGGENAGGEVRVWDAGTGKE